MQTTPLVRKTSYTLGFAAVLTLSGCQSGADIGGMISAGTGLAGAATMSDEQMQQLGDQTIAQLDAENQLVASDSQYAERLASLTQGWENIDGNDLEYNVYQLDDINAFAVPNGSIRLHTGLMDAMTDDEVRYVIAHEIGHVALGHSKRAFQVAYAASAAREAAAASGSKTAAALSSSQLGELGEKLVNAQFSQRQENEADDYAVELMQQYNLNAEASLTALRKLEAAYGNNSSFFSSHPAPGERAERLEATLN
ncbi:M48 family metalloprotease [Vreelandella venusta]|uniref:Peptidase n=1 Tax=Vreelandella venusta TaxID=44935 RepID=A0ABX2BE19_9GAMM|nr:M48 family metalloprotease [Halomonas venusta]MBR9925351.1 M48 family metalloprotease [Gammaproteobacteria bacterium]AZM97472.1 peptidase [Halomonas venusta]MDW0358878.1 M48 family metalloprotease [Halomonas venusta]NPT31289.1 peptidase [Halomonas venusta]QPI63760.1 M48 family metalloprotease [Halomonas venusta]